MRPPPLPICALAGLLTILAMPPSLPASLQPSLRDYTHMWWAFGWHGRSTVGEQIRCVRTGYYGFAMDVEKLSLLRLGPVAEATPYLDAVSEDNSTVFGLPPANLTLSLRANGRDYHCTGASASEAGAASPARLIESGRFVQRGDIQYLRFDHPDGDRLPVIARFEFVAWPETLTLRLDASPGTRTWQGARRLCRGVHRICRQRSCTTR